MGEFFAMGGYGAYVWSCYGVTAAALIALLVWSVLGARRREDELTALRSLVRADQTTKATSFGEVSSPIKRPVRAERDQRSDETEAPAPGATRVAGE